MADQPLFFQSFKWSGNFSMCLSQDSIRTAPCAQTSKECVHVQRFLVQSDWMHPKNADRKARKAMGVNNDY